MSVFQIRIYNADGSAYVPFKANVATDTDRRYVVVYAKNYQTEDNPNSDNNKKLVDFGFVVNSSIPVNAVRGGSTTAGDSPYEVVNDNAYFLGRSNVFQRNDASTFIWTVVHEMTHGLGMAHNCGNKDYKFTKACTMTYNSWWLQDANGALIPWSGGNRGSDLCAEHIQHVRRAKLESDNTPPGWRMLGW